MPMNNRYDILTVRVLLVGALFVLPSCCRKGAPTAATTAESALARVGSVTITPEDLDYYLKDKYAGRTDVNTRQLALTALVERAQFAQAALDAGLGKHPVVRQEMARLLESQLREQQLFPMIKAAGQIPEARLRERYQAQLGRFQSPERRQVAVLWLDPGRDPARQQQYEEKLDQAREWLLDNGELRDNVSRGFGVLGNDYSEHQATRFKGGIVGWLERAGGMDAWRRAVAKIAYSIDTVGAVSQVVTTPEGIFLVRLMNRKPGACLSFDSVSGLLENEERTRLRAQLEADFKQAIATDHPVMWLAARGSPPSDL
jgi:hypothetical protein